MNRVQDLGPGAQKIELERRLDANQKKVDQASATSRKSARKQHASPEDKPDPNDSVREALDKSRY